MSKNLLTVVLDISYNPNCLINPKKAFLLHYKKRCNLVSYFPENIYMLKSINQTYLVPSIIQVNSLPKFNYLKIPSRIAIFHRDFFTCAYCGEICSNPTIDHVLPKSKGGGWSWDNLVTCCEDCNQKKGDSIWKPIYVKPHKPKTIEISIRKYYNTFHPYMFELLSTLNINIDKNLKLVT